MRSDQVVHNFVWSSTALGEPGSVFPVPSLQVLHPSKLSLALAERAQLPQPLLFRQVHQCSSTALALVCVFLVPEQGAVSGWGLMSAEISWLFLLLQPALLLVFAAVSFLRPSWPVVPTTACPALEQWQSCWNMGLCLDDRLNRTP